MYIRSMPPDPKKKRFEVHFLPSEQALIKKLADAENRSVKNWLETAIREKLKEVKKK